MPYERWPFSVSVGSIAPRIFNRTVSGDNAVGNSL